MIYLLLEKAFLVYNKKVFYQSSILILTRIFGTTGLLHMLGGKKA
jgi:hypothetical protein